MILNRKIIVAISAVCVVAMAASCGLSAKDQNTTKLYYAIANNNLQGVKEALKENPDINLEKLRQSDTTSFSLDGSANLKDKRALAIALFDSDDTIAEFLINAGADVNDSKDQYTYLHEVIGNHSLELSKDLIDHGADVNAGSESVLADFFRYRYPNMVAGEDKLKLLIDSGAQYDKQVVEACLGNEWRYLYAKQVLQSIEKTGISSGLDESLAAAIMGNDDALQGIVAKGKVKNKKETLLFAAATCNEKTLKLMKEKGYDFSVEDDYGTTLLHVAALCNSKDVVEYLLSTGLDATSTTNEDYYQPITYAVIGAKTETLKYMLGQGYDYQRGEKYYNADYDDDFQAWSWTAACQYGSLASIQSMVDTGYKCSSHDYYFGYTGGADYAVKFLLENNIPVQPYKWGLITEGILTEYIPEVLSRGAKMSNFRFRQLCENRNLEMIKFILDNPSYSKGLDKERALEEAIGYGALDVVQYLVGQGADINKKLDDEGEYRGCTSMHYAAQGASADILSYLFENGGDVNVKNNNGETPADFAQSIQEEIGLDENYELLTGE